jgi:hypothetical protein
VHYFRIIGCNVFILDLWFVTFHKSSRLFAALAATGCNNEMDCEPWHSQGLRSISLLQPVAAIVRPKTKRQVFRHNFFPLYYLSAGFRRPPSSTYCRGGGTFFFFFFFSFFLFSSLNFLSFFIARVKL